MWLFSFWIYPIALLLVCSELVQSCADFIFVIDGSASAPQQFKRVIKLLRGITDELRIDSSTGHRVAILEYSSLAKSSKWRRYYFEHISSDPALAEVINQLPHIQGITDTGSALRVVIDEYMPSRRNGIPLIIFTITDGYYRDHEIVQKNIAKLLSFPNTHLFAATPSSSFNLKGLLSLTNGEISRLAYGQDALERSKQMLQQFTSCRSRHAEIRRKPQNKALLSITRKNSQTTARRTTLRSRRSTPRRATTRRSSAPTTTRRTTTRRTTTTAPFTGQPGCQVDVILLMDFSGGVDNKRDDYVKLASSLVKNLHLGPFNAQIAMIRYSGPGRTETIFHLNKYTNASAAIEEMKRVPHMGGTTRTGEAITYATSEFDQRYGARKGAKRLIIIFTDGYSQEDPSDAALEARKSGIEIDAVAVEDDLVPPDMDQLVMIANGISNVYMASKFEKLMSRVMDPLRKCK